MKKHLLSNSLLSIFIGLLLGVFDFFIVPSVSAVYYFAIFFYWIIYCGQSILLFQITQTPSRFIMFYNISTVIKMIFSGLFIVVYFLTSQDGGDNYFFGFFLALYFLYLVLNVRGFFKNKNETKT
tara:strand:- start:1355 stop:1729 length:375 start_codon:yes stop_codon:yes gene_type:complete